MVSVRPESTVRVGACMLNVSPAINVAVWDGVIANRGGEPVSVSNQARLVTVNIPSVKVGKVKSNVSGVNLTRW